MKKIFLLFVILTLFAAQAESQTKFEAGVIGGIQLPFISDRSSSSYELNVNNKIGFLGGIVLDLFPKNFIGLQSELFYNNKLGEVEFLQRVNGNIIYSDTGDFSAEYLTYGLKAKFNHSNIYFSPYFSVGVQFNFYLNDKISSAKTPYPYEVEFSESMKRFFVSLSIGAGVKFRLSGKTRMLLEMNFTPSIEDFFDTKYFNVKAKYNTVELRTGILFGF